MAGTLVALALFACWLVRGWGGAATTDDVRVTGSVVFSVFAFACAVAAAVATRANRRTAWVALSAGLGGWVVGDLVWAYYQLVQEAEPPFPSVADVAFLLLPLAIVVAWIASPPGGRQVGVRALLDAVVVATALFVVVWVLVLAEVFHTATGPSAQSVIFVAYALTDVAMVTLSLVFIANAGPEQRWTMGLVAVGLVVIAFADCTSVYLRAHDSNASNLTTVSWALGAVLLGGGALVAAQHPGPAAVTVTRRTGPTTWLPYSPMPIAAVLGFIATWSTPDLRPIVVAVAVMVGATFARQFLVMAENRSLIDTVAQQALRDPLTGLANRVLFADELSYAMRLQQQDGREVAVLSLDLDDFNLVNDNMGHSWGDTLLQSVADRLRSSVRPGDTVARLGGDEFAVLIQDGPQPTAEVITRITEVFDRPFFLSGEELYIHPSIGLARAPTNEAVDPDEVFKRADLAMFTAKRSGIGGVQTYTTDMRRIDRDDVSADPSPNGQKRRTSVAGIQLLGQLRRAIDDSELTLVYQPKISLSTDAVVGVEALVRWPHPDFGLLTPNQFLPLVRRNGLMGAVTDLVLDQAVQAAASWFDPNQCAVPVAINLFAPSLNDLTLPRRISAALDRADLPPAALSVEITEHLLLADIRRASAVITELRASGLRIAIDDFGTGYATMSYLRDLSIDELKLDRQFIVPILRSVRAAAIVRSLVDLAHALGIACVAEGVEDEATADRLREYGCDIAQGHYFSRPMPADELRQRLRLECGSSATFPIGG